ncbi:MAG: DrmE family protein [Eubacteriales bacterium]|nr:DrmE family protein [Eubacteriales bacterium]
MLEWSDYLKRVVESETVMDSFTLSCNGETMHISPIVKASILMLEDMTANQGNHNVFVFPEIDHALKEFLIAKVVFDITAGKIQMSYDPEKFQKGQILKYKGCSVKFEKIETGEDGFTRIFVKFSDGMSYGVPVEFAPYFQISDSKKLSTYKRFKTKYSALDAKEAFENPTLAKSFVETLENHKTHLSGSVFYVSPVKYSREFLSSALINGRKVSEILYMAQVNGDGNLANLSSGQLSGNPAIIIASDLYAVQNAIAKGVVPQTIIVDVSQPNVVDKQLDVFDALGRIGMSIVCVTSTANSFELFALKDRHYNIWRWDHNSITESVVSTEPSTSNRRIRNCADHSVEYRHLNDDYISCAVRLLYGQKSVVEEQQPKVITAYEKLFSLAFLALRNVVPLDASNRDRYTSIVADCISDIEHEKRFMGSDLYTALLEAANALMPVFSNTYTNNKYEEICSLVLSEKYESICIVIPEKLDRVKCQEYWDSLDLDCNISVMYPLEHEEHLDCDYELVVVVGWLGNRTMRQIIYGFSSQNYLVLTYPCEEKWKNSHTKGWRRSLNNSENGEVIKKSFSKGHYQISTSRFENAEPEEIITPEVDELDDIELVIKTTKYKQYGGNARSADVVDAYPVSFVGGYLAFYRSGHKALVVTDLITNNGDRIISKLPEKLEVGDFIVIRESGRDMIRTIADLILERSEKADLRSLSSKWKEALSVETLFSSYEEIYDKLRENGCGKDYATVRNWMTNEDLIQPNDKEDLICIAKATGDQVLLEKLDEIYEAGKEVRSAHIQAGRILSNRLKQKIGEFIQNLGEIDVFNVWDPISLQIDEIGQVKILKVIDISSAIPVDAGNTNRLLSE